MAYLQFYDIGISSMAAAVPEQVVVNREYTEYFDAVTASDIVDKTGIHKRRFAPKHICSSDLCYYAAQKLIDDNGIDKSEIDMLIFVSQTPDYRMPATSLILQDRLGLSKQTGAFDINLGCSAFVYSLSVAFSFATQQNIRKVLLLDGETRSRVYSPKDRTTAFLFGDGGVAAIIERIDGIGNSWFSLNSDGGKSDFIRIDAGGYRNPSTHETLEERIVDEYGNMRSQEHGYMRGGDVFNFAIQEVPKSIIDLLRFANIREDDIDYYILHQANEFMNNYLVKKLKLPKYKAPQSLKYYGNTSSVSIPLTIVSQLKTQLLSKKQLLLSGFGVGMSWASALLQFSDCKISDIVEVE